jgi:phage gp29-like protein
VTTASKAIPALLRAAPPNTSGNAGPVGLFTNAASRADALMGAITSLQDQDEVLMRAGIRRYQLRELEFDDEISAALDTRRDAVISTPWRLDPADGAGSAFITEQLTPIIDDILRGAWAAVPYGYSVMEAVYQPLPSGRIGLLSCGERPMEWFKLYRDGRVVLMMSEAGHELDCDLHYKHFITRRNATWRNPQGDAVLSRLYWAWHFRLNAWRYWIQFLERFGSPILLGKGHNPKKLAEALVAMGASSAVAVGTDEDVTAVTSGVAGEFERAEEALARRVQKVILGQTLTTDVGGRGGSFAAAKVHEGVRQDRKNADLRLIQPTIQAIVNALWWLNRFPGEPPKFTQSDGQGLQAERADRDAKLVGAGIVRLTEDYMLRAYDYEKGDIELPDLNDAPVAPPGASGATNPQAGPRRGQGGARAQAGGAATFAPGARFTRRQQEVEAGAESALGAADFGGLIDPDAVRRAIRASRDPEDLAYRLSLLVPESAGSEFDDLLSRALFAADVIGYVQEANEGEALAGGARQSLHVPTSQPPTQLSEVTAALLAMASRPQAPNFSVVLPQGLELSIPQPIVNVDVAAPAVTFAPQVHMPEQPIAEPPTVNVNVTPTLALDASAQLAPGDKPWPTRTIIEKRDQQGRATEFVTRPID